MAARALTVWAYELPHLPKAAMAVDLATMGAAAASTAVGAATLAVAGCVPAVAAAVAAEGDPSVVAVVVAVQMPGQKITALAVVARAQPW